MKYTSAILTLAVLAAGAFWWVSGISPDAPLAIENARVRLVPGGGPMAGYMDIRNHSDAQIRLVEARSGAFGRVMIHRSVLEGGRAAMQHQAGGVRIEPGEVVSFEPGGLHLMLMQPQQTLKVGDPVEIVLEFDGIEPRLRPVSFTVVPVTAP
ncbi:MAG: copper chaperone PCu(A)C [Wenzhouxiangellaceae bacterium]|nr:copper chaperone PCu(A)C [Wenzhouxiangellaceae bacterium]